MNVSGDVILKVTTLISGIGLTLKIQVIVQAASGIKSGAAMRTAVARGKVLADGQFIFTLPAQDRLGVIFLQRPYLGRVRRGFGVAIEAGIILIAAFEAYGNDIFIRVIMNTSGKRINGFALYYR